METKIRTKIDVNLEDFSDEVTELIPDLIESKEHQKKIRTRKSKGKSLIISKIIK